MKNMMSALVCVEVGLLPTGALDTSSLCTGILLTPVKEASLERAIPYIITSANV